MNNNNYIYILILFLFSIIIIIKFFKNYEFFNNFNLNSDCSENPLINSVPPDRTDMYVKTTDLSTENKTILKTNIVVPDVYDHDNNPLTNKLPIELALITSKNIIPHIYPENKKEVKEINEDKIEDSRCTFEKFYKRLC